MVIHEIDVAVTGGNYVFTKSGQGMDTDPLVLLSNSTYHFKGVPSAHPIQFSGITPSAIDGESHTMDGDHVYGSFSLTTGAETQTGTVMCKNHTYMALTYKVEGGVVVTGGSGVDVDVDVDVSTTSGGDSDASSSMWIWIIAVLLVCVGTFVLVGRQQ